MNGHIALHRKLLDNPTVCKDADHLAIWIWLLLHAVWDSYDVTFHGKRLTLQPGQLTTGRKVIADELKISQSKVQRVLKEFESEHQIEQRTDRQCRLITIVSWDKYQLGEQRNEHQVNNDRTTSEQRVNTNKESNKENKVNKEKNSNRRFTPPSREEVQAYIDEKGYSVSAERFIDYYTANGWMVGKNHMKDWKATVRNWERNNGNDTRRSGKERQGVRGAVREREDALRDGTPEWFKPVPAFPTNERSQDDA